MYAGGRTGASWVGAGTARRRPAAARGGHPRPDRGRRARVAGAVQRTAWADLWTRDPWTNGAYAAFAPGQYTRFWGGTAQPDGNAHFAGEATSTYSQGYLNGGVESGDRAAVEVMRKLGVHVPPSLANLPH